MGELRDEFLQMFVKRLPNKLTNLFLPKKVINPNQPGFS